MELCWVPAARVALEANEGGETSAKLSQMFKSKQTLPKKERKLDKNGKRADESVNDDGPQRT